MDDFVGQFQIALQVTSPKKRMFLLDWMGVSQPPRPPHELTRRPPAPSEPSKPSNDTWPKAGSLSAGACKRPRPGHCGILAAVPRLPDGLPDRSPHGSPQQGRQGPAGEQPPASIARNQARTDLAGRCACREQCQKIVFTMAFLDHGTEGVDPVCDVQHDRGLLEGPRCQRPPEHACAAACRTC